MPQDLKPKTTILKSGDSRVRTRADLTAILWWDKTDVCMLRNIHNAPSEGNFCNERGKAIKPQIVMDYNHHMGYVDKGDRMANSYTTSRRTFNRYILHSSCGGKKISHRDFRFTLVRNTLDQNGEYQGHWVDHLKLKSVLLGLRCAAANIGRSRLRRN
jgi:hypothetical protein